MTPSPAELDQVRSAMASVRAAVRASERIKLPAVDASASTPDAVAYAPNCFGGILGAFRYQMEGEEDLLHLIVTRIDGSPVSVEEGREIADVVWADVPRALVWFRPGHFGQHFYVGHDDLVADVQARNPPASARQAKPKG